MPRRAQLALALILLLVLAPMASATCGIECLAVTQHHPTQTATTQHRCVRASACCHSSGLAICAATQTPEAVAALLSTSSAPHDTPALAVTTAQFPLHRLRTLAGHSVDSSPPGRLRAANSIPLRV